MLRSSLTSECGFLRSGASDSWLRCGGTGRWHWRCRVQTDIAGRVEMPITCARCYDHKFGPVLQHGACVVTAVLNTAAVLRSIPGRECGDLHGNEGTAPEAGRACAIQFGHVTGCPVEIRVLHVTIFLPGLDHEWRAGRDQSREFRLAAFRVHVKRQLFS